MTRMLIVAVAGLLLLPMTASAIPLLQLYVEGGTYDAVTESWVIDFTAGDPVRLWVIGNVAGPGSQGTIHDVKISVAYESSVGPDPVFNITGSTTGGFGGYTDPSTPANPTFLRTVTDGSVPTLFNGSDLPNHGSYGPGVDWQEYSLGNMDSPDSPVGDFIGSFPAPISSNVAQINVYEITVTGDIEWFHIDAYDHTASRTRVFAPFSHDAHAVPEPAAIVGLLTLGLGGLFGRSRVFRHK